MSAKKSFCFLCECPKAFNTSLWQTFGLTGFQKTSKDLAFSILCDGHQPMDSVWHTQTLLEQL